MTRIDDYELISKLGEGGMGAVFKARQVSLDRTVALKVLPSKLAKDNAFIQRFQREARATAKLNHPNIVTGIGVGEAGGYHYFAMEYVEGETLKARINREGILAENAILRIGIAIGSALSHAHEVGIVHRDVKPDNILLANDGTPKLADLGLAKAEDTTDGSLTQTGTAMGTPHYIAPEQAAGRKDVDGRADSYAFGCTLFHAATGHTPFEAATPALLMVKHLNEKLPHPHSFRPDLSNALCLVLSHLIARDPKDRYANLKDAVQDMEAVLAGSSPRCGTLPLSKINFLPDPTARAARQAERVLSRRHDPDAADRAESRRKIPENNKGKAWLPLAAAGGAALLLGAVVLAFTRHEPEKSAQSSPEKAAPASTNVAAQDQTPVFPQSHAPAAIVSSVDKIDKKEPESAGSPEEQLRHVVEKLKAANPGFEGKVESKIEGGKVVELIICTQAIKDISPLRSLLGLKSLSLVSNSKNESLLTDLNPLKGMQLSTLNIAGTKVTDLSPLKGMPLANLQLQGSTVRDLTPLFGMQLKSLLCYSCYKINDLSPLQGMPLEILGCGWTEIADLAPLQHLPLKDLHIESIKTDDIAPLKTLHLKDIKLDFKPALHSQILQAMNSLEWINGMPVKDFWTKVGIPEKER